MQPTTFTRFPDLPPELRLRIWTFTLPGSQIVRVNCFQKAPIALHINRESRALALRHYELVDDHAPFQYWHRCVKGYIDFEVDAIQINGLGSCERIDKKIRNLRNNIWHWGLVSAHRAHLWTDIAASKFPRMKSSLGVIHYDTDLRSFGDTNAPKRLTEKEFQEKIEFILAVTHRHNDAIKASKALEGVRWEPPTHTFVRCERDAAGLKCHRSRPTG